MRCAIVLALLAIGFRPALAERVETYWRLQPVEQSAPTAADHGQTFFEQRLLPVRLVRLADPVTIGRRTLPADTFLYLVFNDDGRIGFCTLKDRSPGNQARTLFIPMLDRRPCLVDSDNDGRFDGTFSVFDKWGGPPSVRGSIDAATPLGATAAYRDTDPGEFPVDMRMLLEFTGSPDNPARTRMRVSFSDPIGGVWEEARGTATTDGTVFQIANVQVLLRSLAGGRASFQLEWTPSIYISSDNRNNLYWQPLPAFLASN